MIKIGEMNILKIIREDAWGVYLDAGKEGEILLPNKHTNENRSLGDSIEVFVYLDSDDQITATTRKPLGQVNRFSFLKVAQVNPVGAFLDWGLPKDVLVPYDEQRVPMVEGNFYVVFIYLDEKTKRIVASSKIDRFLKSLNDAFVQSEKVNLLLHSHTDLGFKCIVNHSHWGVVYDKDIFQRLTIGQEISGYIKRIRDDGKIDLTLHPPGYAGIDGVAEKILNKLKAEGGFLPVTDKSAPRIIYGLFGVSKKAYKNAVGALYKRRLVSLNADGIRLTE